MNLKLQWTVIGVSVLNMLKKTAFPALQNWCKKSNLGLCLGSMSEIVLITQGCFSYCWADPRPFLPLILPHQWTAWGLHSKMEENTAGMADPNWAKGCSIPYDVMLSNKSQVEKKEEGRHSVLWHLSSHVTVMCDGAWLPWGWLNKLPVSGKWWINSFCWLVVLIKVDLFEPKNLLTFTLLILFPIIAGESEQAGVWVLDADQP